MFHKYTFSVNVSCKSIQVHYICCLLNNKICNKLKHNKDGTSWHQAATSSWVKTNDEQQEEKHKRQHKNEIKQSRIKLALCGTDGRLLLRAKFLKFSKSCDTKTRRDIKKSDLTKFRYCPLIKESAVTCQLPLKMAEEMRRQILKMEEFLTLNATCDLDLDVG